MPRSETTVLEDRLMREKDRVSRLEGQLADARRSAGRIMLAMVEKKIPRSRCATIWRTSLSHVDRMVTRAREEGR